MVLVGLVDGCPLLGGAGGWLGGLLDDAGGWLGGTLNGADGGPGGPVAVGGGGPGGGGGGSTGTGGSPAWTPRGHLEGYLAAPPGRRTQTLRPGTQLRTQPFSGPGRNQDANFAREMSPFRFRTQPGRSKNVRDAEFPGRNQDATRDATGQLENVHMTRFSGRATRVDPRTRDPRTLATCDPGRATRGG